MMSASLRLGVDPGIIVMAIAWGDVWANMTRPFWALPAPGLAELSAKDIMGHCVVVLLVVRAFIFLAFLAWVGLSA